MGAPYDLLPASTVISASWGPVGAGSIHQAIDDPWDSPNDSDYAQGSNNVWDYAIFRFNPMIDTVAVNGINMKVRFNNAGAGSGQQFDFGIRIGGVLYLHGPVSPAAPYGELEHPWFLNPATGAPWTKPQLDVLEGVIGTEDSSGAVDSVRVSQALVRVDHEGISVALSDAREQATAYLMARREQRETVYLTCKPKVLDRDLFEDLSVVHPDIPHAQGLGAGLEPWQRSLQQILSFRIHPAENTVEVTARGRHGYLFTYLDGGESRRSSSPTEDGVPRLSAGGKTVYERASNAWVRDPGSGLYTQVGVNSRPIARDGLLLENLASNGLKYSSARDGAGSLGPGKITRTGDGVNGSSITAHATPPDPMFDTSASGFAYRFLAGSPHSTNLRAAWPATPSYAANTKLRVWFQYLNGGTGAGSRLQWELTRAVDGFYWNDSSGAWQSGAVANLATLSAVRTQMTSKRISTGGSATTLSLAITAPSGGTNGRQDFVYHVQSEGNYWATSPVVTDAALYTREIQKNRVENNTGKRSLRNDRFTGFVDAQTTWDAADMDAYGGFPLVFEARHDASNWWRAFYNSTVGSRLDFEARVAGTTYLTHVPWPVVAGVHYRLGFLATSADGELGLPPRSFVAFVDGVPGTPNTRPGNPTEAGTSDLYVGTDSSGNALNAHVRRIRFAPEVYTYEEIARGGV